MALFPMPPVLKPGDGELPRAARLSLLGASTLHLAVAFFLASPASMWLMFFRSAGTVPGLAAVGLALLWAPRSLMALLTVGYGLAGLGLLGVAAYYGGDRHGADLLIAAHGVPFMLMALMLGYAWKRLPRRPKTA